MYTVFTVFKIGIIAAFFACAFATYPLQGKMFSSLWLHLWLHLCAAPLILNHHRSLFGGFKNSNDVRIVWRSLEYESRNNEAKT